ncbi:Glycosyl Hydrolase Family 88 [Catalinimonas alkaloidigena]|uniref:Glycosyl Hydrolase Family 88 n=1 Tax=Catalinimonas alkaloidigena TaxID=1075417 RepID=A0A1G9F0B7_9BACT|nr:alginate lyase family protein [Catalinimonas alkaloidigena]SDK81758.1 Glycosyl Hydrolase Family 88 [Catalinimonas alkaloidigena]
MHHALRFLLFLLLPIACHPPAVHETAEVPLPLHESLQRAQTQLMRVATLYQDSAGLPRTTRPDGSVRLLASDDWTSGFFPGTLWLLYEYTADPAVQQMAMQYTARLAKEQYNRGTHDLGFMLYNSYGTGYALTGDEAYRDVLVQGARALMSRFRPATGTIRSWDHHATQWQYPVIIDNMMNLELLFAATRLTGDSSFYRVAYQHALTTLRHHFRSDFSSYHVVDYDTTSGEVRQRQTHQGAADESAWARGQAWGLYGFTVAYRETGDAQFLALAQRIATFVLEHPHLPDDKIPYWDFDAPDIPDAPRDASAAAILASALLELSAYSPDMQATYRQTARTILQTLSAPPYRNTAPDASFLLSHSVGHFPEHSEVDVPLNYADYYYVEALLRLHYGEEQRRLATQHPRIFLTTPARLSRAKQLLPTDERSRAALTLLREEADAMVQNGPYSVMEKAFLPPSGDKHDYLSMGIYWWPDSTKRDGLPYVRRDGQINPEVRAISDATYFKNVVEESFQLALVYVFTGEEAYAAHAADLIRHWFLTPETRMNPHLNYGQGVPGHAEGRPYGIIETRDLIKVVDAIGLLQQTAFWTPADEAAMQAWCQAYLRWLRTSRIGQEERDTHNNHGTWYDGQVVTLALYTGQPRIARQTALAFRTRRLDPQLAPDGSQPEELARTRSWDYSIMNLRAMLNMVYLADQVGVNLWSYETAQGSGIPAALRYLQPVARGEREWTTTQIHPLQPEKLWPLVQMAASRETNTFAAQPEGEPSEAYAQELLYYPAQQ